MAMAICLQGEDGAGGDSKRPDNSYGRGKVALRVPFNPDSKELLSEGAE
jgi:hypothetical protein